MGRRHHTGLPASKPFWEVTAIFRGLQNEKTAIVVLVPVIESASCQRQGTPVEDINNSVPQGETLLVPGWIHDLLQMDKYLNIPTSEEKHWKEKQFSKWYLHAWKYLPQLDRTCKNQLKRLHHLHSPYRFAAALEELEMSPTAPSIVFVLSLSFMVCVYMLFLMFYPI